MNSSRNLNDGKEFLEDGIRQSNVPHFDVLEDAEWTGSICSENGPKQTNASAYLSGKGTLSRSQKDADRCSTRSLRRSRVVKNEVSSQDHYSHIRQSDGRDLSAEDQQRRWPDYERNTSEQVEDQWLAHKLHPSSKANLRLGITHGHEHSRLSTEGSFHLSHLEGDYVSDGSDEMEYSSGSEHLSPVQGMTEAYIHESLSTNPYHNFKPRSRRDHGNRIKNSSSSSKYNGLSWQQYKALATRRKEAESHTSWMNIEEINGPSNTFPENHSTSFNQDQQGTLQRGVSTDRSTEPHGPSQLSDAALNMFQGQDDQRTDLLLHGHIARAPTLVDGQHGFNSGVNNYGSGGFEQEYLDNGKHQRPHFSGTDRYHPSPFYNNSEGDDDTLDLDELALPSDTSATRTTSVSSILEFRRISHRTKKSQGARQNADSVLTRTDSSDSKLEQIKQRMPSAENHLKLMHPTVLEQNNSGAHLTKQNLPSASSSASKRAVSGNSSSFGQKPSRRRKLEPEFSNTQAAIGSEVSGRTRLKAEGSAKSLGISSTTDLETKVNSTKDRAMPNSVLSSGSSSDWMTRSGNEDQRISSRLLQETGYQYMFTHQHGGHYTQNNLLSKTEDKDELTPEASASFRSHSVLQSDTLVSHPQRSVTDVLKLSKPTSSMNPAFPDGFDPVQDLLISSPILSASIAKTTSAKDTSSSFRPQGPNNVRTSQDYVLTTSKGLVSQYSSALSSISVQSSEVPDQLPLQTSSTLESHLEQHYPYTGSSSTNQQSDKTVTSSMNQTSGRSVHSNLLELDHRSSIETAAYVHQTDASKRDWYPNFGSHLESSQLGDLQDIPSNRDHLPILFKGQRPELKREMNYHHFDEESHQDLSQGTLSQNHRYKMQRHYTKRASYMNSDRLTKMDFSPSGSPRRVTSILWVFKLLDILNNHPEDKHEQLVSQAYWFRRWLSKVRLLKMIHQEEKDKWRRAVTLHNITIQQKCIRQWTASVQSRSRSARLLYQQCLLHKGFSAFKFAVMSSKVRTIQLETRLKVMTLAKYFNKWSTLTQLRQEKEAILDQIANQHVTVKAFSAWKEGYHMKQRLGIADLHYKVSLLTKFLDNWKVYINQRRKEFYQREVARVFHEEMLVKRAWITMTTMYAERQKARRQFRRSMLCRSWRAWRHGLQIIKLENLHDNTKAMIFRDHVALQRIFTEWKEKANVSMMKHRREKTQLSQAFELWKLKHRRRHMLGLILDSKARKSLRKKTFTAWRQYTKHSLEAQQEGVRLIERVHMGVIMSSWQCWTCKQLRQRKNLQEHQGVRNAGLVHGAFYQWKLCWLKENAVHQGLKRWSEECLKRAVQRWKQLVVERRQLDKAEEFLRRSQKVFLRFFFSKWTEAKAQADHEQQRAADMHAILTHSQLHRTFLAWKLEMLETRAVTPLTERREKRCLARAFDGWRDIIIRKMRGLRFADRRKNTITSRTFTYWRKRTEYRIQTRQEQDSLETSLIQGCFQAWQRLHQREMTRRVVTKQRETGCLRDAFSSWRAQREEVEMERDIRMGDEQRRQVLQKVFFNAWRRVTGKETEIENERCSLIQTQLDASIILDMWKRWRTSLELELRARSFAEKKNQHRLKEAFHSWHQYTQQSMDAAIDRFQEKLNESSSSFQSQSLLATLPPSLSSSSSSSSPLSSPASVSSSQWKIDRTSPSYASSPSPLQELSVHLVRESNEESFSSAIERRVVQPSASLGSVEDVVEGGTSSGEDSSANVLPDRIIRTPSPLRNLPLPSSNSSVDQEVEDFIHLRPFEVKGQLMSGEGSVMNLDQGVESSSPFEVKGQMESGEGSVMSLDQGIESSSPSVGSQPSCFGVSSITDSGYHGNGYATFSNGGSQVEASSDSTSLRSSKDYGNSTDALQKSPHKNNNNSASQLMELPPNPEEWAGLTKLWCSSEDPPGENDYLLLDEMVSPESVVPNGHQALPVANSSGNSPRLPAMSTVIDFQVEHRNSMQRTCTYSSKDEIYQYMMDGNLDDINDPVEVESILEEEEDDGDEDIISNGSLGAESFRQTTKIITDRKAYLRSIILRLRLWPASAVFYQWLQYTRIKKLHRHYKALVEGRLNDADLRSAFQHWRQCRSDSQLANNYLNKRLLERYFRNWTSTKERVSKQETQIAVAEKHASHKLLQSAWSMWKENFLQSLYPIGPRPTLSTHFSQSQLMSKRCASFRAKLQDRNVRECLVFWRLRLKQLREVDHYRTHVILTRCLLAWFCWSREKRWRHEAAMKLLEARRKRMAFQHWRSQLAKLHLVHTHYHGAVHSHLCIIIRAWHRWAESNKRLRLSEEVVKQRCNAHLLSQAWLLWKQEERKNRCAHDWNDGRIILRTFSGWKSVIHDLKRRRLILNSIQSRQQHTTLSSCFNHWKIEYNRRRMEHNRRWFAEMHKDRLARRTMAEVLATWQLFVAERRCERKNQKEVLKEAFSIWRNQYLNMKRQKQLALSAATHWRHVVKRSRELKETMTLFRCSVEERDRKQAFLWWQRSWIGHQLADRHRSNRLLNRSMEGLKKRVELSRSLCVMKQYIMSKNQKTLLELYFRKWKQRHSHMTALYVASAKVKGDVADRSLAVAFHEWRLRYQERQTEQSYKQKLIQRVWQTWRRTQANHQRAESKRADKEKTLLRQSFNALHNWARDHSGRRIVLQCVQSRKNHFTLKMIFAIWRDESRLRQLAKQHHNMYIQRKVLICWSRFNQKKKVLTALHQMVKSKENRRRQNIAFRVWKEAYIATGEAEAKVQDFLKKKETLLLTRSIMHWRDEVHEAQVQRIRERRMMRWGVIRWRRSMEKRRLIRQYERDLEELAVLHWEQTVRRGHFDKWRSTLESMRRQRRDCYLEQKYGLIWKYRVSHIVMAQAMARYLRIEKYWRAWRRRFIVDQVSRRTLEGDQRDSLTKVFTTWHQLVIRGRTNLTS